MVYQFILSSHCIPPLNHCSEAEGTKLLCDCTFKALVYRYSLYLMLLSLVFCIYNVYTKCNLLGLLKILFIIIDKITIIENFINYNWWNCFCCLVFCFGCKESLKSLNSFTLGYFLQYVSILSISFFPSDSLFKLSIIEEAKRLSLTP